MAKHDTLPEYLYQRHLEVGDKFNLDFEDGEDEDLNEHEASEELVSLTKTSKNLMKVVTKKLTSLQMITIPKASKMN